jgi:hypothetical protein
MPSTELSEILRNVLAQGRWGRSRRCVSVTRFFRAPSTFAAIRDRLLPALLAEKI